MKCILVSKLILFVFLLISQKSHAQHQASAEKRAARVTQWMKKNLHLTEDQEGSVYEINLKYASISETLKLSGQSRMQRIRAMRVNNESKARELESVLTEDQFEIYEDRKDELRKKLKKEAKSRRKEDRTSKR